MNFKFLSAAFTAALLCSNPIQAQNDPVLFTVQNKEIRVSEFKYIYDKNNGSKADYSEKSLREYLQLYSDFKLQIIKGEELKINENEAIKKEQAQYRSQLANNYLTDREITEKLVKEAYERSKEDRKIAHIFVQLRDNATTEEIKETSDRLRKVKDMCNEANFAEMVKQHSEDGFSKNTGGDLGFFAALQLDYDLETAAWNTPKGKISDIVRSPYGWHLLRVTETRPAYGQIQTAQILVRDKSEIGKKLADSLFAVLRTGGDFDDLVKRFSEDNSSKTQNGIIGWVAINKYSSEFENAAFALKKDGDIAAPVQSSAGWHILKRVKAQINPIFTEVKSELTDKVKKDSRFNLVQSTLVERIKKEANYNIDSKIRAEILETWKKDATFYNAQWAADAKLAADERVLFTLGNQKTLIKDFIAAALRFVPERINMSPQTHDAAFDRILNKLLTQRALAYEETQLEIKYPDFKSLLREYEEGILLFEVKKQLIWDKASADSVGLKLFYEANPNKYQAKEIANISTFLINSTDKKVIKTIKKAAKTMKAEELKTKFNADQALLFSSNADVEKGKNAAIDKMKWKIGSLSNNTVTPDNKTSFMKMEKITPARPKSLDEARGFVVADYQEKLEKDLLKELRSKYPPKIDETVLKTLTKK
jgi:peptidyl-prolyl cis-trans isomerase SurA